MALIRTTRVHVFIHSQSHSPYNSPPGAMGEHGARPSHQMLHDTEHLQACCYQNCMQLAQELVCIVLEDRRCATIQELQAHLSHHVTLSNLDDPKPFGRAADKISKYFHIMELLYLPYS